MASNTSKENKMGVMPVKRLIISMALPMMISMLVQALYNVVDSIFVARLGENALSAVTYAFPLQSLMIAVGSGTGVGMNALLSRSLGQKDQERADKTAMNGILLAIISALVFTVLASYGGQESIVICAASEQFRNDALQEQLNEKFPQYNITVMYMATGKAAAKIYAGGLTGAGVNNE